jgi:hypothetical protein
LEEKRKFGDAISERDKRLAKLEAELEALKNPPPAEPDYETDPKGYIKHVTKESAKEVIAKLDEHGQKIGQVAEENTKTAKQREEAEFVDHLDRTGQLFTQQHPDYGNALGHVRAIAYRQMKVYHPDASDEQIMDAISKQEIALARQATAAGRNPHEMAYALALANGYQPQRSAPDGKKNGKQPPTRRTVLQPSDEDGDEVLDPDLTLGRSNGEAGGDDEDDDLPDPNKVDPFDTAMREAFMPRQRRRA